MWYTWPPGRKKVSHVGCRQLLLTKGAPIYLVSPFIEGAKVPSYRGQGNLSREALDQPITHHGRLDPSSTLGVHNWSAIFVLPQLWYKMASRFEQYFLLTLIVLFCLNCIGVRPKNGRRTTNLVEWTPLNRWQHMDCSDPGRKIYKKMQENHHEPLF